MKLNLDAEQKKIEKFIGEFAMKMLSEKVFNQIRQCIYRNARNVEISWWKYLFENGSQEEVVSALKAYQNEDGGFGNGLEPDCSNPNSTPATTYMAYTRLSSVGCDKKKHPMIQGIMKYMEETEYFTEHGWYWSIPSNNTYPCQPWYEFPNAPWFPKDWPAENYVNGGLISFVLKYFDKEHEIYKKTLKVIEYRISLMEKYADFCTFTGEWNQESIEANDWVDLFDAIEKYHIKTQEECQCLKIRFMDIVNESAVPKVRSEIERRIQKRNYTNEELDNIIEHLSRGRVWNDEQFIYDPVNGLVYDTSNGNEQSMKPAELWWNFISAIKDLQILTQNDRVRK